MIVHTSSVPTTARLREVVQSPERDFPYVLMESDLSRFSGRCSPWHWHEHFEFAVVARGRMELRTRNSAVWIEEGDGYFVNANVLHLCRAAEDVPSVQLHVHQFEPGLLGGAGLIARRYVAPVENAADFEAMPLRVGANGRLIAALNAAYAAAEADAPGWELESCARLMLAWRELCAVAPAPSEGGGAREDVRRVKIMLSFVHENYARAIRVEEIARAAGVSERECFRCFAQVLDTTPKAYLTRCRVAAAARRLAETGDSITQIAYDCGFADSSYFTKVFRQTMGCSPRAYRRK